MVALKSESISLPATRIQLGETHGCYKIESPDPKSTRVHLQRFSITMIVAIAERLQRHRAEQIAG